jgi:hypothetical protein
MHVPVVNQNQQPLMPTHLWRALKWIALGRATGFFKRGVFCVRLNNPSGQETQFIAVGIDTGSKREAYAVKSRGHTYLNILSNAVDWVKDAVEARKNARSARRNRTTPCRQNRENRNIGGIPPSTKARWQLKLRVCRWLSRLFPIRKFVVEDIQATTFKGKRKWNRCFSPLEVGKKWFYDQLSSLDIVETRQGWETKQLRDNLGLNKLKDKLSESFYTHNIDSWVMANDATGGHIKPDNERIVRLFPLQLHRRQLHMFQPARGNIRRNYGGTRSLGLKRGSFVKHNKLGVTYVGGTSNGRVSLHAISNGVRLTQNAKIEDIKFLSYSSWRTAFLPGLKHLGFHA